MSLSYPSSFTRPVLVLLLFYCTMYSYNHLGHGPMQLCSIVPAWRFCCSRHDIFAVLSPCSFFFVRFLSLTCPLPVLQIVTVPVVVFRMSFFLYFLCIKTTSYTFLRYSINFEAHYMIVSFFAFLCPQSKQALPSHLHIHSYKPMLIFLFIDFHQLLHIQSLLLMPMNLRLALFLLVYSRLAY